MSNLEKLQAYHSGVLSQPVSSTESVPPPEYDPNGLPKYPPPPVADSTRIDQLFARLRTLERVVAGLQARLDEQEGGK